MKTIDEIIKDATLQRMRDLNNNRVKVSRSLGIGVRTLGMWLTKWGWSPQVQTPVETKPTSTEPAGS